MGDNEPMISVDELSSFAERNDRGDEGANVVDGLFAMARAIDRAASKLDMIADVMSTPEVGEALHGLARLGAIPEAMDDGSGCVSHLMADFLVSSEFTMALKGVSGLTSIAESLERLAAEYG